jgi:hypothetical protein
MLVNLVLFASTFYFSFAYCVIWKEMQYAIIFGWALSMVIDMLILEVLVEGLITILFCCRETRIIGWIWSGLNSYRSYKALLLI